MRQQEPQIFEDEKNVAYIKGFTGNELTKKVMCDIHCIKKPNGIPLNRKNVALPFEDILPIETLCQRHDCSLFLFSSHSKKRPNNLTMGRLFEGKLLDMVELGIEGYKSIQELKAKMTLGVKPLLLFCGEAFDTDFEYMRIKNLLNDFFLGPKPTYAKVSGIEHVIMFLVADGKILMRPYLIEQKKLGNSGRMAAQLHDMGPQVDFAVRRVKIASHDQFTEACKHRIVNNKPRKNKNITTDQLGTTHGKIHIGKQNFDKMYNVKY